MHKYEIKYTLNGIHSIEYVMASSEMNARKIFLAKMPGAKIFSSRRVD